MAFAVSSDRLPNRDVGTGGSRYDTSLSDVRRANEGAWSRFPMRTMQADHQLPRGVRDLALCRVARRGRSLKRKTAARSLKRR
jgi:hypothetical protein